MTKKTCFMISPAGEDGAAVSDALLFAARAALEKHGYRVLGPKDVSKVNKITQDIIELIQKSELCIIVLSQNDPNVFYEAGRRHETGKPYIQLVNKDEMIPFDLMDWPSVPYGNILLADEIEKTAKSIESHLEAIEKYNIENKGEEKTSQDILGILGRLEGKMEDVLKAVLDQIKVGSDKKGAAIRSKSENPSTVRRQK